MSLPRRTPHRTNLYWLLAAFMLTAGCESEIEADDEVSEEEESDGDKKRTNKSAKEGGETVPAAAPAKAEPASPVDLDKMTWTEDGTTRNLAHVDLSKRCLLKDMSMVLPEGASIKPLMGSRGCIVRAWGGDDGPFMFVVNDALPVTMNPRDKVKGLTKVVEETDDSWIAELDNPKVKLLGRYTKKFGKHTYYCVPNAQGVASVEVMRGMMKLCHTLTDDNKDDAKKDAGKATAKAAPKPVDKKRYAQQQNDKLKGVFGN